MKQSALFFDIDGTLTDNDTGVIQQSALEAIEKARQKGHLAFINTGRTICSIQKEIRDLKFDGFLCGCGIYALYRDEIIFNYNLDRKKGKDIIDRMIECKIDGVLEGEKDLYFVTDHSRFPIMEFMRNIYTNMGLGRESIRGKKEVPYDKFFIVTDEQSDTEKFFRYIDHDMEIIDREFGQYEIIPKGFSKATIIKFIQEKFGIEDEDVYVFGDSNNDLAMFQYAKHTVAMGEHAPELEPYTEFITKNARDGGIAYAMKHYGFI